MPYLDSFARPINYLRISVTDRCNLRCVYCMPPEGIELRSHYEVLTFEEIARVVEAAAAIGITKIRLTGGEPLARLGLPQLARMLAAVPGIDDISMTTNGTLLARHADALAAAGLHRVNVSLDTLHPERFRHITRCGALADVWDGIEAAQRAGLKPIKLNTVVIRGMNEDEVTDFAQVTLASPWHVRFIEIMPLGANAAWAGDGYVPMTEVRVRIEAAIGSLKLVWAIASPLFLGAAGSVVGAKPAEAKMKKGTNIYFIGHECIGCQTCRALCPAKAVHFGDTGNEIDQNKCIHCGTCYRECPISVVTETEI